MSQIVEDGTSKDLEWQQEEDKLSMKIGAFEEQMLPVIKVTLNDALQVMPRKTIHLENKQQMTADDFYYGYGYHEQGNYNSMKQVVVRYTTYLLKLLESISLKQLSIVVFGIIWGTLEH